MKRTLVVAALAASLMGVGVGGASAQDLSLPPAFGSTTLNYGFLPDPYSVYIPSGGSIDASYLGNGCYGYVANAPDYRLYYNSNAGQPLYIYANSSSDTTLVINGPDGSWYCDDDSAGYPNPVVTFYGAQSGQYDIWVGSYSAGGGADATLYISEIGYGGGGGIPPASIPPQQGGGYPDASQPGAFGNVTLYAGFQPDPYTVGIPSGGGIDAYAALGGSCTGYIATAPDYEVYYTAGGYALSFIVQSSSDTTLVINDPAGNWYCDDDSYGYPNPWVKFYSPLSGTYDVWVGSYSSGGGASATLTVTETQ